MSKRLIWAEGDDFIGWCCSHRTWGISAPRLERVPLRRSHSTALRKRVSRSTTAPTALREKQDKGCRRTHFSLLATKSHAAPWLGFPAQPHKPKSPNRSGFLAALRREIRDPRLTMNPRANTVPLCTGFRSDAPIPRDEPAPSCLGSPGTDETLVMSSFARYPRLAGRQRILHTRSASRFSGGTRA